MDNTEDSIFLLESRDANNQAFGTGFAVARRDGRTWLLTCAHVVQQLDGNLRIGKLEAAVIANGEQQGIDLALVAVSGLDDVPLLADWTEGREDSAIRLRGYSRIDPKRPDKEKRRLDGALGQRTARNTPDGQGDTQGEARVWDLSLDTDDFSKLKRGYSGSPVYDDQGGVLVVTGWRSTRGMPESGTHLSRSDSTTRPRICVPIWSRTSASNRSRSPSRRTVAPS